MTRLCSTRRSRTPSTSSTPSPPQTASAASEGPAADEDREAREQGALGVARGGRSSTRSSRSASAGARAGRGCCRRGRRASAQPVEERGRVEDPQPRGGKLDGKRQAVEPPADLRDCRHVLRRTAPTRPRRERRDRGRAGPPSDSAQGRTGVLVSRRGSAAAFGSSTSEVHAGQPRASRDDRSASTTCSKLSSTSSTRSVASWSSIVSSRARALAAHPERLAAIARRPDRAVGASASGTKKTPSG